MASAFYLNKAIDVVQKVNEIGTRNLGAEHRLGCDELEVIAEAMQNAVKEESEHIYEAMRRGGVCNAREMRDNNWHQASVVRAELSGKSE